MKVLWTVLIALATLCIGAAAGVLYATVLGSVITFKVACSLLDTAQASGYLNNQQRGDVLDKVIAKEDLHLDAKEREALAKLKTLGCGI